jgi:hypothetical protein
LFNAFISLSKTVAASLPLLAGAPSSQPPARPDLIADSGARPTSLAGPSLPAANGAGTRTLATPHSGAVLNFVFTRVVNH